MSTYTKIVVESDSCGRIQIAALNDEGYGHGHRLAGRKYNEGGGKPLGEAVLGGEDIAALREYAAIWERVNLLGVAPEVHDLSDALRWYLRDRTSAEKFPEFQGRPHNVEREQKAREKLRDALLVAYEALRPSGEELSS